ncbi:MAG: DUF1292 domain-containing protein [Erysipelotrichaceae bacterium]|nr:DUF1292 domain-containing protein [Erysipelotrichaceae bacterium]
MKKKFIVINDEGLEVEYDILFTFDSDDTGKSYIVYTDYSKDDEGNIQVYSSVYDPKLENPQLEEIKTAKEIKVINDMLNTMIESTKVRKHINEKD